MTDKDIKEGNTLLVKGPARVIIDEGKLEIFGKRFSSEIEEPDQEEEEEEEEIDIYDESEFEAQNVLIIPSGNRYPLHALKDLELEAYTSQEEQLEKVDGDTIPDEWKELRDTMLEYIKKKKFEKPLKIMVMGLSNGKTTLIKYLANSLLDKDLNIAYLDSDLGQQIVYFPTTINIGKIKEPVVSSEDIEPEDTVFIGATFPKGNYKFIVSHACDNLIKQYYENNPNTDAVLIDTDGWIKTEAGIIYKSFFIKTVDPDVILVFKDEEVEEFNKILEKAEERKDRDILIIEDENEYYYEKSKEERRWIRQSIFSKGFEDFQKITIPLSKNEIEFVKLDYDEENDKIVEKELNPREIINLPYHYVIISILDENDKLINIGLLFVINLEKDYVLVFSDLDYKEQMRVKKIMLGSLRLSTKGNHQGYLYI
ncbi:MAG: Clp1/GlmU family protein [Promethearchaeia archaeon]